MRALRTLIILAALVVAGLVAFAGPASGQPELTFTEPDELALALPSDDYKTVWLRSEAPGGTDIEWRLLVDKGAAAPQVVRESGALGTAKGPALEVQGAKGIAANAADRYRIRVKRLSTDDVKGAQLVASIPGAAPATLDTSISAKSDPSPTIAEVLWVPIVVALLLMFVRGLFLPGKFGGDVGTVDLDFSKSFATTLTAIGALLGTILSAGFVDDTASPITKSGFQALNLTFGVVILAAPLVYLVFQKKETTTEQVTENGQTKTKTETHYKGKTWALLASAAITLWAVLGEIWTIYLLLGQIDAAGAISSTEITIMQGAVGIGAILALVYSLRKLGWIVATAKGDTAPALTGGFMPIQATPQPSKALPTWTPL